MPDNSRRVSTRSRTSAWCLSACKMVRSTLLRFLFRSWGFPKENLPISKIPKTYFCNDLIHKSNCMKSIIIALQLQDCARVVQSWTRPAFPIENVRKIINPSPIDQSRLQCDFKRMSNPAIIHWIGNQILGTCFFFNPDRIGPIIWQSTKNVAIRLQF